MLEKVLLIPGANLFTERKLAFYINTSHLAVNFCRKAPSSSLVSTFLGPCLLGHDFHSNSHWLAVLGYLNPFIRSAAFTAFLKLSGLVSYLFPCTARVLIISQGWSNHDNKRFAAGVTDFVSLGISRNLTPADKTNWQYPLPNSHFLLALILKVHFCSGIIC